MKYYIGYFNRHWNKTDFVILATTKSEGASHFIKDSYNDAYKRANFTTSATVLTEYELPEEHRYAE